MTKDNVLAFNLPKNKSSVIKVIGVGGGGSNAVNYMFHHGIDGVDFAVCNTDLQALESSPIPNKIQIGVEITEGLGAGANPDVGRQAAEESIDKIEELLDSNTKMLFITAGMGGGTGTGAAPVIARIAKEKEILTVGVVTVPFWTEGGNRKEFAEVGLEELRENVDTLLVINNDKLIEVYGDLTLSQAFGKANEVLNTATKGIAEVISQTLMVNIDLNDAKRVLRNSGTAVMGQAYASGENRAIDAVEGALDSPLLNDNNIKGAKQVLLKIVTGKGEQEIRMTELFNIKKYIQDAAGCDVNIIEGIGVEESLENKISVTVIATGFEIKDGFNSSQPESQKVYSLDEEINENDVNNEFDNNNVNDCEEDDQQATLKFDDSFDKKQSSNIEFTENKINLSQNTKNDNEDSIENNFNDINRIEKDQELNIDEEPIVHTLEIDDSIVENDESSKFQEIEKTPINNEVSAEQMAIRSRERMDRLREISFKLRTPSGLTDLENEPAYKRRNIDLENITHSSESDVSEYTLNEDEDKNLGIQPNNFLHDNVD
tara:strand:+ start:1048 stop:2682 length:1635 start_codon:yes stop_codon:yes gene_type:complete